MKYIIPENKLDKIVFKYLDIYLKGLEKRKTNYYKGIILAYPNQDYGILGWENDGFLYIYHEIINEISTNFGLNESDSELVIGRWVSDRYKLKVINTITSNRRSRRLLAIDTN